MFESLHIEQNASEELDALIPFLAQQAWARAQQAALVHSGKVLCAINGQLIEKYADGTQRFIRQLPAPIKVTLGRKIRLRPRQK